MTYYKRHIFFCTQQRDNGEACCDDKNAVTLRDYTKNKIKQMGLLGEGAIRVNNSGCLGRCEHGPVAVVYPDTVWYSYKDESDMDDIINEHLVKGKVVDRLKID